jgi:tetratricopeptide (TPR) repeat protein
VNVGGPTEAPVADVTTASMGAYDLFLRGREAYWKAYRSEARDYLERAVRADSTFAVAWLYLGRVYSALNRDRERDDAYRAAMRLVSRAAEKDRLYIEAAYAHMVEKDTAKRERILRDLVRRYPREKEAYQALGLCFMSQGRDEIAQRAALALDPRPPSTPWPTPTRGWGRWEKRKSISIATLRSARRMPTHSIPWVIFVSTWGT